MKDLPRWLHDLSNTFADDHHRLYLVGGAIRDELLEKPIKEWDCTTDAKPPEIEKLLRQFGCTNISLIGKRFGTISGSFHNEPIEITTFRSESYTDDSRKPTVEFGSTIEEDLSRRDFTINALALEISTGRLLDPYDGQSDLKNKVIKAVGNPRERFAEDPLRMLRAIRFMTGIDFIIEFTTLQAIGLEKERFAILSGERISQELNKILLSQEPSRAIRAFVETGLISYILPELLPSIDLEFDPGEHKDIYAHILQVLDAAEPTLALRWCALLHDIAKPVTRRKIAGEYHFLGHEVLGAKMARTILRRLKYANEFTDYVSKLVYLHQRIPNYDGSWSDGGVRRFARDAGETLEDLFKFAAADTTGKNQKKLTLYRKYREDLYHRIKVLEQQAEIAKIKSPLSGEELMALFHRPAGAWIKPIKEHLLNLVLDGKLAQDDKTKATEIAKSLLKN